MNDGKTRTISTKRGRLVIHPDGSIDGLWRVIQRELLTGQQVRELAGGVERHTLLRWRRQHDFPPPRVSWPAARGKLELWSRTEVEAWLSAWRAR